MLTLVPSAGKDASFICYERIGRNASLLLSATKKGRPLFFSKKFFCPFFAMIPFYAEELGNIHVLRATISVDSISNVAEQLQVKNSALSLNDNMIADLSSVDMAVSTNNLIVAQPDNVSTEEGALIPWEIKLTLERSPTPLRSQQAEAKEWWSSKTLLEQTENKQLTCKHCSQLLLDPQAEYKIKDLPSEHWYELVECWICHETKPEEHQSRMKPILARPNLLLVGSTYFLIHTDNLIPDSIQTDDTANARVNVSTPINDDICTDLKKVGNALDIIAGRYKNPRLNKDIQQFVEEKDISLSEGSRFLASYYHVKHFY